MQKGNGNMKIGMFLAIAVLASGADAQTVYWSGGGANNKLYTNGNWVDESGAVVKNVTRHYDLVFPSGVDATVDVTGNPYYGNMTLAAGTGRVTFVGDGASLLPATGAVLAVGEGRELVVDDGAIVLLSDDAGIPHGSSMRGTVRLVSGKVWTPESSYTLCGNARIIVEGGELYDNNKYLNVTNNAVVEIRGGTVRAWMYIYGSDDPSETGGTLRVCGGTYIQDAGFAYETVMTPGGHFEFVRGAVQWGKEGDATSSCRLSTYGQYGNADLFDSVLPQTGCNLFLPGAGTAGVLNFGNSGTWTLSGTVWATNTSSQSTGMVKFDDMGKTMTLNGRSMIYANAWNVGRSDVVMADLAALYMGSGGFINGNTTYQAQLVLTNGIAFGSFAGNPVLGDANLTTTVYGPLSFDTANAFGNGERHDLTAYGFDIAGATELKATGGGRVAVTTSKTPAQLRTIEVGDGTTLALTNGTAKLKTMNLKLGKNATLKIDLSKGDYVDAAAVATYGEGAKISVAKLPATLTEGTFYEIYSAPAGTEPSLSLVDYAEGDWPEGWFLKRTANCICLTDGKVSPVQTARDGSTKNWSGAGEDALFANSANWVDGSVPGGGCTANFHGKCNTDIEIESAVMLRQFFLSSSAGAPYAFSGAKIKFQYPATSAIDDGVDSVDLRGAFPVTIANDIAQNVSGYALRFQSFEEGSISLLGNSDTTSPLDFGGDVRIGGTWQASVLRAKRNYGASVVGRRSHLTVMPGARLTLTDQTGDVNEGASAATPSAAYLAIAAGGAMTVGGSDLTFGLCENEHYVDGTLEVTCPLVAGKRQVFRGDGTLKLLGGCTCGGGTDGGLRLEGNLTLVPSDWSGVPLEVRDAVTIAPAADWTYGAAPNLAVENHAKLTLATGGHTITFLSPIVTEGEIEVTGGGRLILAAAGSRIGKITCRDGATIGASDALLTGSGFADILTVREPDAAPVFDETLKTKFRMSDGRVVYSAKRRRGMILMVR